MAKSNEEQQLSILQAVEVELSSRRQRDGPVLSQAERQAGASTDEVNRDGQQSFESSPGQSRSASP